MSEVLGRGGVSAILSNSHPRFTTLSRTALTPYTNALIELIRADMAAGTLRRDLDPDTVVSLLFGAFPGELARHSRVDEGFTERCVDLMWVAMRGAATATDGTPMVRPALTEQTGPHPDSVSGSGWGRPAGCRC